jgi:iron complex outermembrane receptor protein
VEVLRGPQGTLYGASSMGGLLKFVTVDPSTEAMSGRVQAGTSAIRNGEELGYSVRGAVNVPLGGKVAVRASVFTRRDAGHIDAPARGAEDVNVADAHGGRLSALWEISDLVSLRMSALAQKIDGDGSSEVHLLPGLGEWDQSTVRGSGRYARRAQAHSATLKARLGSGELTSLSGYGVNEAADAQDFSYGFLGSIRMRTPGLPRASCS